MLLSSGDGDLKEWKPRKEYFLNGKIVPSLPSDYDP